MSAREKVSLQQITNALLKWRGQVKPAAEELGIARNSLMRRIESQGLNLAGYRRIGMRGIGGTGVPPITAMPAMPPLPGSAPFGQENRGAHFTEGGRAPKIPRVSSSAAVAEIVETKRRQTIRIRIPPEHLDKLTDAKYDLQALLRRDVTEQQIVEEFLDSCLSDFLARKIASVRQPERTEQPERPGRRGKDKR